MRKIPVDSTRVGFLRHLAKVQTLYQTRKDRDAHRMMWAHWENFLKPDVVRSMRRQSHPLYYKIYRKRTLRHAGPYPEMREAIVDFDPEVILHPSVLEGLFISDLCLLSKELNKPLIAMMNSWDNPSTKAMVVGHPDRLLVWGDQTRHHAIRMMGMPEDRVHVTGSAQFDVYRQPQTVPRDEICRLLGVAPQNKLLVYAGSSKSINEIEHLKVLDDAADRGDLADTTIVFRPHPWRAPAKGEPDFSDMSWRHTVMDPNAVHAYNASRDSGGSKINLSDYLDTHNLLCAADALVSNVSTILLEAAMHGVPIACVVSDRDLQTNDFLRIVFESLYFNELLDRLKIPRIAEASDLVSQCQKLLHQSKDPDFRQKQIEQTRYFVDMQGQGYSERLDSIIEEILGSRAG